MDYNQRQIIKGLGRSGGSFDRAWVEDAHALLMLLLNVRTGNLQEECQDFSNLFRAGRSAKSLSDGNWPTKTTDSVLREWRMYRSMTREMVRARGLVDWLEIAKHYPKDLLERASRLPAEKDPQEIYDPMDVIWIGWTYGRVNEIDYRECATPGCERYAAVSFPKRAGRQPRYCAVCNASTRDRTGHKRRKNDYDKKCWEIVREALERLPENERRIASDDDRRRIAKRIFKLVKRELTNVPGKRGERWIAKQLKKGISDEQS